MPFKLILYATLSISIISCSFSKSRITTEEKPLAITEDFRHVQQNNLSDTELQIQQLFKEHKSYISDGFDFPVGKPNAKGYYNAQRFGKNLHLGDDWNSVKGGNSDLGDPIYSIANGYVNFAQDIGGGWGKVIRIWHYTSENKIIESLYAHCDTMLVNEGSFIKKGAKIGTIGTADGQYLAHLHFEIREDVNLSIGGGYSTNTAGYLDPTEFIKSNR